MIPCAKCGAVPERVPEYGRYQYTAPKCRCSVSTTSYRGIWHGDMWEDQQERILGSAVSDLLGDSATVARVTALIAAGIESERIAKLHAEDYEIRTLRAPSAHDDRPECEQPDTCKWTKSTQYDGSYDAGCTQNPEGRNFDHPLTDLHFACCPFCERKIEVEE